MNMYECYLSTDASLLEINPLVQTQDNNIIALDSKFNFDGNALFRHPEIKDMRDLTEEDDMEVEAGKYNLNYIKLDGNVGCMVNGAGLAMATMDIIKLAGGNQLIFWMLEEPLVLKLLKMVFELFYQIKMFELF